MNRTLTAIAALALTSAGTAHAQFPGDIFVDQPSVVADPGDEVVITVQGFSGGIPFGASGAQVVYDPDALELLDATREQDGAIVEPDALLVEPGRASIAVVNGEELDGPVGTVVMARMRFRVADSARGFVPVDVLHRGYVSTDGTPLPFSRGFGADVFVRTPAPATLASLQGDPVLSDDSVLQSRAMRLRRPGFAVGVVDDAGEPHVRMIDNVDPNAPTTD